MSTINLNRLEKLVTLPAVSGDEKELHDFLAEEFSRLNYDLIKDNLGSIFAVRNYNENKPNLMISTNMDENGVIVSDINKDGSLKLVSVGKLAIKDFKNQNGILLTRRHEQHSGVFYEYKDEITFDLGYDSAEDVAKAGIKIGDFIVLERHFKENEAVIIANNLSNRLSLEVLISLLENDYDLDYNLFIGGITHSLVGERAAITATTRIKPDLALVLDSKQADVKNYSDIAIRYFDPSMLPSNQWVNFLEQVASDQNINLQPIFSKDATDGSFIHKSLSGAPTAVITIPMKSKSPFNHLVKKDAVDSMIHFLDQLIKHLNYDDFKSLNELVGTRYE